MCSPYNSDTSEMANVQVRMRAMVWSWFAKLTNVIICVPLARWRLCYDLSASGVFRTPQSMLLDGDVSGAPTLKVSTLTVVLAARRAMRLAKLASRCVRKKCAPSSSRCEFAISRIDFKLRVDDLPGALDELAAAP